MVKILKINFGFAGCDTEIELEVSDNATKIEIEDLAYDIFREEVLTTCTYELIDVDCE